MGVVGKFTEALHPRGINTGKFIKKASSNPLGGRPPATVSRLQVQEPSKKVSAPSRPRATRSRHVPAPGRPEATKSRNVKAPRTVKPTAKRATAVKSPKKTVDKPGPRKVAPKARKPTTPLPPSKHPVTDRTFVPESPPRLDMPNPQRRRTISSPVTLYLPITKQNQEGGKVKQVGTLFESPEAAKEAVGRTRVVPIEVPTGVNGYHFPDHFSPDDGQATLFPNGDWYFTPGADLTPETSGPASRGAPGPGNWVSGIARNEPGFTLAPDAPDDWALGRFNVSGSSQIQAARPPPVDIDSDFPIEMYNQEDLQARSWVGGFGQLAAAEMLRTNEVGWTPPITEGFSEASYDQPEYVITALDDLMKRMSLAEDTVTYRASAPFEGMNLTEGAQFTDKSFVSSTASQDFAEYFASFVGIEGSDLTVFEIKSPKGTAATYSPKGGAMPINPHEMIFDRGMVFRVGKIKKSPSGGRLVELTVLPGSHNSP